MQEMLNKIILGDCMDIMRGMPDRCVDSVITDIPYDAVNRTGFDRQKYKGQIRKFDKGVADKLDFDLDIFLDECIRVCNGNFLIFCGKEQISSIAAVFQDKLQLMRVGFWEKNNPTPVNAQYAYCSGVEPFVFGRKPNSYWGGGVKNPVYRFPVETDKPHPTTKNRELMMAIVQDLCPPDGIVLDPCAGSCSTGIACHILGRKFIMIEKNEEFYNSALKETARVFNQLNLFNTGG